MNIKRVFLVTCLALGLIVAGLAVFLATFDADRYRPMLVSKVEAALGKPIRLDRLALRWRGGLALELKHLAIYPEAPAQGEPAIHIDTVSAVIRLLPLLRREVQVASLLLDHPRLRLRRDAQGQINLLGLGAIAAPVSASGKTATVGTEPVSFNVDSLRVHDGLLHWTDAMASPPLDLDIQALDATLTHLSMTRPIDVRVRAALLSDRQNLSLSGRVHPPANTQPPFLEAVRLEMDLNHLKTADLSRLLPILESLELREGVAGNLLVVIDRLRLDPEGLAGLTAQIHLTGGRIPLAHAASPLENVTLDASAEAGRLTLKRFSTNVANGTVLITGSADHLETQPQATFQATIDHVALGTLLPRRGPTETQLRGRLSVSFQGAFEGVAWPQIAHTLSGQGRLLLKDGSVANVNIVQEVFRRLSVLPGLLEMLQARLPESYQAKLNTRDTVFLQPIELSVTAQNGWLAFKEFHVATDTVQMSGTGRLGLDGTLNCDTMLWIGPELSAAIIKSVHELQYLVDAHGRLQLPVVIQGSLPRIVVLPDVQYVASRLVATKAEELLGNLFQRILEKHGGPATEGQATGGTPSSPPPPLDQ